MKTKIFILFTALLSFAILTCDKKPTEPKYDNPFDIENPQTGGDPFQLTAKIAGGGIALEWNRPDFDALQSYKIYRSEQEGTGYSELGTTDAKKTNYVDKSIENGHSYWYLITVVNTEGKETGRTNVAAVNINTEPVLVINGGSKYTASNEVTLTILAISAQQMMLSNNVDFSSAVWENYTTSTIWSLSTGDGQKLVYMKIKYDSTESEIVKSVIILDTTPPIIALTVTPDSGITNETNFQFDPTGSSDNLSSLEDLQIRFDYESDGTYDSDWQSLAISYYQYLVGGGDKNIKMQLKDAADNQVEITINAFINNRPQASFFATEDEYNSKVWHFNASMSFDFEDETNLEFRWDFEGDGSWNTDFIVRDTISFEYSSDGNFSPTLTVRDQNRLDNEYSVSFNVYEKGILTDIDGNIYKTIKIGDQCWMAENLKVTKYRNGETIRNIANDNDWSSHTGAYCAYNVDTYGLLYNWYAVDDGRNIAPEGWHVPTHEDWKQLEMYLGMSQSEADRWGYRGTDEGSKLKAESGWYNNSNGTNESGFTALPGGYCNEYGTCCIGKSGNWWSSTSYDDYNESWFRELDHDRSDIYSNPYYHGYGNKSFCFSVRLIRN